jgi:large subunit ribosomal protein L24
MISKSLKIRKGDTVVVIKGKNRGKRGKILRTIPKAASVLIDGVNEKIRHTRPKKQGQKGQRITVNHPVASANVMLVCNSCSKATRVGFDVSGDKKIRMCKKCKKSIS